MLHPPRNRVDVPQHCEPVRCGQPDHPPTRAEVALVEPAARTNTRVLPRRGAQFLDLWRASTKAKHDPLTRRLAAGKDQAHGYQGPADEKEGGDCLP